MKNQKNLKGLCIAALCITTFLFPSTSFSQQTLIKVQDWNAYVHLPWDYQLHPEKNYPTILFIPGLGEIGTNPSKLISNGPGAYLKQGWNGNVKAGADSVKFIIISLQPPSAYPRPWTVKDRVDELRTKYRIGDLYLTGLSMGGNTSLWYSYYYPTEVKAVVGVESVVPSDGEGTDYEKNILETYRAPAEAKQKYLLFEQINDWRRNNQVADAMNYWAPGSAQYESTSFGSGGHCCWNEFYGGGNHPTVFDNLQGVNQTIYEWIGRRSIQMGPLPVILENISVQTNKQNIILHWSTSSEKNTTLYEVQRSTNGRDFETIGTVKAAGNSSILLNYTFTDEVPSIGTNFYRLNTVDIDKSNSYSKTVRAEADFANSLLVKNIFFSTKSRELKFSIESHENQEIKMSVYDVNGKIYNQSSIHLTAGSNTIQKSLPIQSHGIYYLSISSGKEVFTQPLFSN